MAVNWWDVLASSAQGYSNAGKAYGDAAKNITGSLLNRKKKKRTVGETPSQGPDPGNEASDMPYVEEDEY